MSNVNAPFGFRWIRHLQGVAPNAMQSMRRIAYGDTNKIFQGDPVVSISTGYIGVASPGTTQLAGIFVGCKYLSTSQKRTVWSNYWPGADATTDPEAYIIDDPNAVFEVQALSTAIALSSVGKNAQFDLGTGSTATGLSGATLTAPDTTDTLPFRIIGFKGDGVFSAIGPGSDSTSLYNYAYVTWNWQDFKSPTGI